MTGEYKIIPLEEEFKIAGNRFLRDFRDGKKLGEEGEQAILKEIWRLLTVFYPEKRKGETTLKISSQRLIELGLVSEEAAEEITGRRIRKTNGYSSIRPQDEPLNIVTVKRLDNGFKISKSFLTEEKNLATETGLRRDTVVEEEAFLIKEGERFCFQMAIREGETHLHAFGQVWLPRSFPSPKTELTAVKVTDKDLVRTLVLVTEATFGRILTAE